jgi:hypothetical protein
VLKDGFLLFYCAAVGFVAAGIAASFFKMVTSEPARFALLGSSWLGLVTTFIFCALTGPAIIMDYALRRRPTDREGLRLLAASVLVAGLWSVCSGILVLQVVLTLGVRPV